MSGLNALTFQGHIYIGEKGPVTPPWYSAKVACSKQTSGERCLLMCCSVSSEGGTQRKT